jgi:formylglycine-generating enzyme required for sulfatase activity
VQLGAFAPGVPNSQLVIEEIPPWLEVNLATALPLPVVTLEPEPLAQWARLVAGTGGTRMPGVLFDPALMEAMAEEMEQTISSRSASELVQHFRATASPTARRLAGLMAAIPVTLPVVRLIQETMLPESGQIHIAEVFMSGLLRPILEGNGNSPNGKNLSPNLSPARREALNDPLTGGNERSGLGAGGLSFSHQSEPIYYDFQPGVRELLLDSIPISDTDEVLEQVSQFIARKAGVSIKSFTAFLSPYAKWDETVQQQIAPFAQVTRQVLRRLGGEYAALAEQLERRSPVIPDVSDDAVSGFPPLQTFTFEEVTLTILQSFNFEVVTVDEHGSIIDHRQGQAQYFSEDLGNGIILEMVAIPGGTFLMGSPETEEGYSTDESPQHWVTVQSFFMGKYPVTQAQWQAVANLPQVNRELNPDPSYFKGANRPVEQVSWYECVEYVERLSQYTGRDYRLPSEAEWEYACRAETTTPFHFGEIIITDLANYDGKTTDDAGVNGKSFKKTTPVGSFQVANAFGLYDMHGNVWEWCADYWHSKYYNAPSDGKAWLSDNEKKFRLLRGGSWSHYRWYCRCANRFWSPPAPKNNGIGFRVVCTVA